MGIRGSDQVRSRFGSTVRVLAFAVAVAVLAGWCCGCSGKAPAGSGEPAAEPSPSQMPPGAVTPPQPSAPAEPDQGQPEPSQPKPDQPSPRPTAPVALDWLPPSPRDKWVTCPYTSRPHDPVNTLVAVVVENSSKARPQSGLVDADVVYEALAEGGISRFLALYHCGIPKVIGPVRSVRPYFAEMAREWGAAIAHCGGDAKDVKPVRDLGLVDVDELRDGRGFWRDASRQMPHNLYVSANNVRSRARESAGGSSPQAVAAAPWGWREWAEKPAKGLDIKYGPQYTVSYGLVSGGYQRSMNSVVHRDRETGNAIVASNVLIQFTNSRIAYADGGLIIDLVGSGKAVFLAGGEFTEGSWEKASRESPTAFKDGSGNTLRCVAGQTWVQIVQANTVVTRR